jgi:hypothetical protein
MPFSTEPGMEFMSCSIFFAFVIFISQSRRKFPLSETTGPTFPPPVRSFGLAPILSSSFITVE